jgi:hypothetical protein
VLQTTIAAHPTTLRQAIAPYREGLAIACECMFAWYWLADLCERGDRLAVAAPRGAGGRPIDKCLVQP